MVNGSLERIKRLIDFLYSFYNFSAILYSQMLLSTSLLPFEVERRDKLASH